MSAQTKPLTISLPFRRLRGGIGLAAIILALSAYAQPPNWSEIKTPFPGPAAAIGSGSNGCLSGAETLPDQGTGFVSIRRNRNRYYGHPELLRLIEDLGHALTKTRSALMMIGDLSQPRGGQMSSAHRSHQNGLDVDIWLTLAPSAASANKDYPDGKSPISMVAAGGLEVTSLWGNAQRFLVKTTAEDPRVDRIFVNPAIKRALCETERGDRSWLRKVRPWWGHDAHLHVRIKCPQGNTDCESQAPLPAGDGCGKELAGWFSDETQKPAKPAKPPKPSAPKPPAILPAACKALLPES